MTDFTSLEIQFIRTAMGNKTPEQVAAILERPIEEVTEKILELNGSIEPKEKPVKKLEDMTIPELIEFQKQRDKQPYEFKKFND